MKMRIDVKFKRKIFRRIFFFLIKDLKIILCVMCINQNNLPASTKCTNMIFNLNVPLFTKLFRPMFNNTLELVKLQTLVKHNRTSITQTPVLILKTYKLIPAYNDRKI